ncbi:MAG: NAD-dependent epimerase/dehydratase family protein [Phyllobacteriaceae bacterium]|nr:NAD-dependent epimerase/dehydratase family protein [Phyllobacteriaceae bacterium]
MKVLVTGARGFIGSSIAARLSSSGHSVVAASRRPDEPIEAATDIRALPNPDAETDCFNRLLDGVDHVVHCAGAAHDPGGTTRNILRQSNVVLTSRLAEAARRSVPGRFVYLSSIRAVAAPSLEAREIDDDTTPSPGDDYARSKLDAENGIGSVYGEDRRFVILRPPPVYGPGMKGALRQAMRLASLPIPLPLAGISGRNTLVSVAALARAAEYALLAADAGGRRFLVGDREPVTIGEIMASFRAGMNRTALIFPVPDIVLRAVLASLGLSTIWTRVAGSIVIKGARFEETGWSPDTNPLLALRALAAAASGHAATRNANDRS